MDKKELERLAAEVQALSEQLQSEVSAVVKNSANVTQEQLNAIEALKAKKANAEKLFAAAKEMAVAAPVAQPAAPPVPAQQHAAGVNPGMPHVQMGAAPKEIEKPFNSFGEQLCAVAQQAMTGRVDERLLIVNKQQQHAASGMNEANPTAGGFMVHRDFVGDLMTSGYDSSKLAAKCKKIPLGANSNGVEISYIDETSRATGSRNGGVQAYWANEAGTATAKKPKLGTLKLDLGKLLAFAYATDELLEDAPALGAIIADAFRKEFAFVIDDAILRGDGAGKPQGILNSNMLVTVSKESGQTPDTVNALNIIKMFANQMNPANAEWFIGQEVTVQLPQMTLSGANAALYMPPGGLSQAPLGTLMGRPVNILEQCSAIGDVGDIMFLDLSAYGIIDKGALKADSSMHVQFLYGEQCFRFSYRVGGGPLRKVAKTAYKGAINPSEFVTLEAR